MEQERIAREKEEQEKKAKEQKIKEEFGDTNSQWEKDKQDMRQQQKRKADGSRQGAAAKAAGAAA